MQPRGCWIDRPTRAKDGPCDISPAGQRHCRDRQASQARDPICRNEYERDIAAERTDVAEGDRLLEWDQQGDGKKRQQGPAHTHYDAHECEGDRGHLFLAPGSRSDGND